MSPHIYSQLIFDKGAKATHWGKVWFLQQMVKPLDRHMQKNEVEPLPHTIYKNELKMDTDLNGRAKTIKRLE